VSLARAWRGLRAQPIIAGVLLGCTLVGIGLGYELLSTDWPLWRRLLGGGVGGAGVGLVITASRMIG
jgi:hypothetical protein